MKYVDKDTLRLKLMKKKGEKNITGLKNIEIFEKEVDE